MSERYERLNKTDLLVAQPVGAKTHKIDIVKMPQGEPGTQILTPVRRSSYGEPFHSHIYDNLNDEHALLRAHVLLDELHTGSPEIGRVATELGMIGSYQLSKGPFKEKGLDTRIKQLRSEYVDIDESERQKTAAILGRAFSGRQAFVVARDMRDDYRDPNLVYYGGKITGIVNLRERDAMQFEPIVSTPHGEGLLPTNMYLFQGIYVPTSSQDLKVLHADADYANV